MLNKSCSLRVIRVDLGLGGIQSESDESWDHDPVVLDGGFSVFGFVGVLVRDFREVNLAHVESVWQVLGEGASSDPTVDQIVTGSSDCVVLLEEHSYRLFFAYLIFINYMSTHFLFNFTKHL